MRTAAARVAVVMLLLGIPSTAHAGGPCDESFPPDEPVELCGLTVVSVTNASVVRVTLTDAVTIQQKVGPGLDIEIDGGAPVAGFVLADPDWRVVFFAGTLPQLPFTTAPIFRVWGEHDGVPGSETFPPGEYLLYVLADGDPVTVTLRLDGLSGRVDLSPTTPAHYGGGFLPPRYSVPTGHYYSADRAEEMPLGGIGLRLAWIEADGPGTATAGVCRSNTEHEEGWLTCGGFGLTSQTPGEYFRSSELSTELFEPGIYNQGGVAHAATSSVRSVGVLAIWLGR